jgi:hypothetical protein
VYPWLLKILLTFLMIVVFRGEWWYHCLSGKLGNSSKVTFPLDSEVFSYQLWTSFRSFDFALLIQSGNEVLLAITSKTRLSSRALLAVLSANSFPLIPQWDAVPYFPIDTLGTCLGAKFFGAENFEIWHYIFLI